MPKQFTGVELDLEKIDEGTIKVKMGSTSIDVYAAEMFDRSTFDHEHMKKNLSLAYHVGGRMDPTSKEYLSAVNGINKGMELASGRWFIREIRMTNNDSQTYEIGFSERQNGPISHTITMEKVEFETDPENPETILKNLKSWLRLEGCNSPADLTTAKLNLLRERPFRY